MLKRIKEKKELAFDIFAIILIVIFAISLSPKSLQNDTFYTVSIGKLITENGIDFQDHFSWHENLPYTYPHWLYDFMMYHIYNIGGWTGIYVSTCIFAAILGICIYKVNSKLTKNQLISFFVTIGSLYLIESYIAARAQLVTFICFILLVYNIEKFIETKKIRYGITQLIILILIANLHVAVWPFAFILYLPYIAEYLICELIEMSLYHKIGILKLKKKIKKIEKKREKDVNNEKLNNIKQNKILKLEELEKRAQQIKNIREENLKNPYKIKLEKNPNVRWLIIIMLIGLLTGLCTPLKEIPYTYTIYTLQGNTMNHISEHLPMTLSQNVKILCTLVIIIGVLTFTKSKIKLCDLFMLGGLSYMMLVSKRQSSMFATIGTIALTRSITDMIYIYTGKNGKSIVKEYISKFLMIVIAFIVIIMSIENLKKKMKTKYVNESTYPVKAADWILENLDINNIKLYNEYNYGSYLLYRGIPVFIDSRCDLYTPQYNDEENHGKNDGKGKDIFSDFINSSNLGTYYGEIFEKYKITHVIIKEGSKMNMLIKKADSEKYKELYSDKSFIIYEVLEY